MRVKMNRRSLLSGLAAGLGMAALDAPLAHASAVRETPPRTDEITNFAVAFSPSGLMGETRGDQEYFEQLLKAAIVPPSLSGYHTDIYCGEIYHLDIGFAYWQRGI